jgi:uncharacterized ubiquitin-like protein YukD
MFAKDNGESITSMLRCRHSNGIKHLIEQFANKFSFNVYKGCEIKIMEKDELLANGVVLIILSDEFETKNGLACSEKDEYEMAIVIDHDIQKFKKTQTMY